MRMLIGLLLTIFFSSLVFAVPTVITPVVPSETVNESGFVTSDGANGNSIKNPGGDVLLVIKNETASAAVATLAVQNASLSIPGFGTVTKSNIVCTLSAGENCVIGPFPPRFWNDGSSNLQLSYTGDSSGALDVLALKR